MTEAYLYRAALWCSTCAAAFPRAEDDEPADSDDVAIGPYADGGGESDTPSACDGCGRFLENPLTDAGVRYVLAELADGTDWAADDAGRVVLDEWREFYHAELWTLAESDADALGRELGRAVQSWIDLDDAERAAEHGCAEWCGACDGTRARALCWASDAASERFSAMLAGEWAGDDLAFVELRELARALGDDSAELMDRVEEAAIEAASDALADRMGA
jgi:hypothetical protein